MSHTTAVVVIGGLPPDRRLAGLLPTPQVVIAADSGLHHAIDLGLRVTCVVGDMDSVDPAVLVGAEVNGVEVLRSPHDKDSTDTELAVAEALARGATHVTVVTGGGGRLDHQLGVLATLTHREFAHATIDAWWDTAHITIAHGPSTRTLEGRIGETLGLHAFGGDATGVTTSGLKWNVADDSFASHSSRGVSNVFAESRARISLTSGTLVITRPHALETT